MHWYSDVAHHVATKMMVSIQGKQDAQTLAGNVQTARPRLSALSYIGIGTKVVH